VLAAAAASFAVAPAGARASLAQAWPAFALVAGLLAIGAAAAREGLFAAAGAWVARAPGGAATLLAGLLAVEAVVTAVLNLDTAVVFVTPVLLHAARRRSLPEEPFLYGAVFVANAASLVLPGSNLTNLIVVSQEPVSGSAFAARLAPAWVAAVTVTVAFLLVAFRRGLAASRPAIAQRPAARLGPGAVGIAAAAVFVLALPQPALPVLVLGCATAIAARLSPRQLWESVSPGVLLGVLALSVVLGAAARGVSPLGRLVGGAGRWESAWLAAGAAVLVNNLPAAVVLSSHLAGHPRALLLGLDLGPNLAVTGSLSGILWLQVARRHGARPSARRYTLLGLGLVPLSLAAALLVTT
jgi:arsenical pump membrane protein